MRSRSERSLVLLLIAAMGAGACVQPKDSGVNVQSIKAELVFGIDKEEPAAPTPFSPPPDISALPQLDFDFDFDIPVVGLPPIQPPPPREVELPCPEPAPGSVPRDISEVNVTALPTPGLYRWRGSAQVIQEDGSLGPVDLGFMTRVLRRVREIDEQTFEFETIQPNYNGIDGSDTQTETFLSTRYRIRTESETVTPPNETGPAVGALDEQGVSAPRVGEPDGGITIVGTQVVDASGNAVSGVASFQPANPLMLLPLPISSGQTFRSSAVDPRSGQTVAVDGQALTRRRINACGDPIDGWLVRIQQTTTGPSGASTIDADFVFAPQYGAIPIDEFIQLSSGESLSFTLSTLDPSPLPETLA